MDGEFVINKAWDPAAINSIEKIEQKTLQTLWVHLMVTDPKNWLEKLTIDSSSIVTIHLESKGGTRETILRIKEKNWLPSLAIKPKTNLSDIFPFLDEVHQVLLMSVEPGSSGQTFIADTIHKLGTLVGYRQTSGLDFKIGMDGGINKENIGMLADRGVDHFGISSGIFGQADPVAALQELNRIIAGTKS